MEPLKAYIYSSFAYMDEIIKIENRMRCVKILLETRTPGEVASIIKLEEVYKELEEEHEKLVVEMCKILNE